MDAPAESGAGIPMSMDDHPNAMLLRQAWQAVAHSDLETLKELWDEEIVWHVTGNNPWQGDHVGHEAVFDYLAQVGESGEAYETSLTSVLANDEYAAVVCHVSSKRGDRVLEVDQVLFGRFENRRMKEIWTLSLDPRAIDKFWS
jgi:ketosteroid isomerase-like protein